MGLHNRIARRNNSRSSIGMQKNQSSSSVLDKSLGADSGNMAPHGAASGLNLEIPIDDPN